MRERRAVSSCSDSSLRGRFCMEEDSGVSEEKNGDETGKIKVYTRGKRIT